MAYLSSFSWCRGTEICFLSVNNGQIALELGVTTRAIFFFLFFFLNRYEKKKP